MAAEPILLTAGQWLGAASGLLAITTVVGYLGRWGVRFRLVGITSFTALLAISCLAFSVSYTQRVSLEGAVTVPVVYDNGGDLLVAAAPADLPEGAAGPATAEGGPEYQAPFRGAWLQLWRGEALLVARSQLR